MNLLIDSDIIIDVLRKRSSAIDWHQQLGTNNLLLSTVSVGEVYHGIHSGGDATQEEALFRRLDSKHRYRSVQFRYSYGLRSVALQIETSRDRARRPRHHDCGHGDPVGFDACDEESKTFRAHRRVETLRLERCAQVIGLLVAAAILRG